VTYEGGNDIATISCNARLRLSLRRCRPGLSFRHDPLAISLVTLKELHHDPKLRRLLVRSAQAPREGVYLAGTANSALSL